MNAQSTSWSRRLVQAVVPAIPFIWLILLFVTPFLIVIKISLSEYAVAQPPYSPHFNWGDIRGFLSQLNTENYSILLGVPITSFVPVVFLSVLAFLTGAVLAFIFALSRWKTRLVMLVLLLLPYLAYGCAYVLNVYGSDHLLAFFNDFIFWEAEVPPLPVLADWLLRFYVLQIVAVIPIVLSTGTLKRRHCFVDGQFSLTLAIESLWRKGKAGLLLAFPAVFSVATLYMMQREFEGDLIYWLAFLSSLKIAVISTAILLLVGFPIAYAMARAPQSWRPVLLAAVMLPFWVVFLIRIYSWKLILEFLGRFLSEWGMISGLLSSPISLLNTDLAVFIGIVYGYLPFMILPLYTTLEKMDMRLVEAATDLGSPPWRTFWTITVPLAKPGILAGSLLCFIPVVGEFVIPELLGGSDTLMIGKTLWNEFFSNRDWPLASSVAVVLLVILVIPMMIFQQTGQLDRDAEEGDAFS